jgi:hypothetical protein
VLLLLLLLSKELRAARCQLATSAAAAAAQSLHSLFRLQRGRARLHLFLTGSRGVLRFFLAFEGPFWGFCYEIISWGAW